MKVSELFSNPLLPQEGIFYVQLIEVETVPSLGSPQPIIAARVRIHPDHGVGDNIVLGSIIYRNDKSKYLRTNFLNTFLSPSENNLQLAIGRWGSVRVYPTQFNKTKYSDIEWIYQPIDIQLACHAMNKEQKKGRLPRLPSNDLPRTPKDELHDKISLWATFTRWIWN